MNKFSSLNKYLAALIFISIVLTGTFKNVIMTQSAHLIAGLLESLRIQPDKVLVYLNSIRADNEWKFDLLGWIAYYPVYLSLHLVFIHFLFFNQKQLRNILLISLSGLIFALLLTIGISKSLGWDLAYEISYETFQKLLGLPFILLAIEGGRHLFKDLE